MIFLNSRGLRVIQRLPTVTKWFNRSLKQKGKQWGYEMTDSISLTDKPQVNTRQLMGWVTNNNSTAEWWNEYEWWMWVDVFWLKIFPCSCNNFYSSWNMLGVTIISNKYSRQQNCLDVWEFWIVDWIYILIKWLNF